jgi:predicted house-cleaning noncanonical NTP pyrophosphatase (MazG superfamily)
MAQHFGRAVDVMFFVDVIPSTGHPPILPWFLTDEGIPVLPEEGTHGRLSARYFIVSNRTDLTVLDRLHLSGSTRQRPSILLRPQVAVLRSRGFLELIAETALTKNLTVDLEGSTLSHAFYFLTKAGVRVRCVDLFAPPRKKQRIGKLVRDLIPVKIERAGEKPRVERVAPLQLLPLLKAKAVEEALELFYERNRDNALEEMADLTEVIASLCDLYGFSLETLSEAVEKKRAERGGFEKGYVLVETEEVPLGGIFSSTEHLGSDQSAVETSKNVDVDMARRPRWGAGGLVVSLVPPEAAKGERELILPLRSSDYVATIKYHGKHASVQFRLDPERNIDPNQLRFPFAEDVRSRPPRPLTIEQLVTTGPAE